MGEALAHRVNMKWMRWVAAALFVVLGVLTLLAGDGAVRVRGRRLARPPAVCPGDRPRHANARGVCVAAE